MEFQPKLLSCHNHGSRCDSGSHKHLHCVFFLPQTMDTSSARPAGPGLLDHTPSAAPLPLNTFWRSRTMQKLKLPCPTAPQHISSLRISQSTCVVFAARCPFEGFCPQPCKRSDHKSRHRDRKARARLASSAEILKTLRVWHLSAQSALFCTKLRDPG